MILDFLSAAKTESKSTSSNRPNFGEKIDDWIKSIRIAFPDQLTTNAPQGAKRSDKQPTGPIQTEEQLEEDVG